MYCRNGSPTRSGNADRRDPDSDGGPEKEANMQNYRIGNSTLNLVVLIGRVVTEPKVRDLPSGAKVATLRVATDRYYEKNGELQRETDFHSVVSFLQHDIERIRNLHPGDHVNIIGSLRTRTWQDAQGATRSSTEVVARKVGVLLTKAEPSGTAKAAAGVPEVTPEEVMPAEVNDLDFLL
jgi:single-strand DNA-binding protein